MLCGYIITQICLSGTSRVYYLLYLESIYLNQMHNQRYIKLEKYTHLITLDISLKITHTQNQVCSQSWVNIVKVSFT